jgi:hypothetical protein
VRDSGCGPGVFVLGGAALLIGIFLVIGFLLPTDWQAEASSSLNATPAEVMVFLDSPEGWQAWTPWPESGLVRSGPERGAGARISWDDQELGSGSFTIDAVRGDESVSYSVDVAGAGNTVMTTQGSVTLTSSAVGVAIQWREAGVLGRNPLMGYWALSMERAQTAEMAKGLDRLGEVVRTRQESGQPLPGNPR